MDLESFDEEGLISILDSLGIQVCNQLTLLYCHFTLDEEWLWG